MPCIYEQQVFNPWPLSYCLTSANENVHYPKILLEFCFLFLKSCMGMIQYDNVTLYRESLEWHNPASPALIRTCWRQLAAP
jgi:hypothetical protein